MNDVNESKFKKEVNALKVQLIQVSLTVTIISIIFTLIDISRDTYKFRIDKTYNFHLIYISFFSIWMLSLILKKYKSAGGLKSKPATKIRIILILNLILFVLLLLVSYNLEVFINLEDSISLQNTYICMFTAFQMWNIWLYKIIKSIIYCRQKGEALS